MENVADARKNKFAAMLRQLGRVALQHIVDRAAKVCPSTQTHDDHGSLFFAAADLLAEQLPSARNAQRAVVIMRLRGRTNLGSTIYNVLERYAQQLSKHGGKLILSGVSDVLHPQLVRTDLFKLVGEEYLVRAERRPAAAMRTALAIGETWLEKSTPQDRTGPAGGE